MPRITINKPIRVQFERGQKPREMGPGQHTLTDDELKHWFIQACLAEGNVALVEEQPSEDRTKTNAAAKADAKDKAEADAKTSVEADTSKADAKGKPEAEVKIDAEAAASKAEIKGKGK